MIEAMPHSKETGQTARVHCDGEDCEATVVVRCSYENQGVHNAVPNAPQVTRKLVDTGWAVVRNRHYCHGCVDRRRAAARKDVKISTEDGTMTTKTRGPVPEGASEQPPRQASRDQKRQIVTMLEGVYDVVNGRYEGKETDHTVAEALGGGIMPGWVAEIREDLFGPDGGNGEMEDLLEQIATLEGRMSAAADAITALGERTGKDREDLKVLRDRVQAMKATLGPKAVRL